MPPMAFHGIVTKAGVMQKTVTVSVTRTVLHKLTRKPIERTKKFLTHDEYGVLRKDDVVIIRNCRHISARKSFRLEKLIQSPEADARKAREMIEAETAQSSDQPSDQQQVL